MKLIIIRHGDPDYSIDSLTEKGWKEAEILSERISKMDIRDIYVSPLGRAKDTASFTLKKMNRTAIELPWLREFAPRVLRPDCEYPRCCWDWLPQDWMSNENFFSHADWTKSEYFDRASINVKEEYKWITDNFDKLLAGYGYIRDGHFYRVEKSNNDTIVFFCHFGLECILISHLLEISPMILWHGLCAAPTSVTTINTEERRKGIANFRISSFGDISHLYAQGEPPAFAARFCECFENENEPHNP